MKFGSRNTYSIHRVTEYSFIIESTSGSGLVCIPKPLIREWIDAYEGGLTSSLVNAREMREVIKQNSEWAMALHSFETHLKGLLDAYLDGTIPKVLYELGRTTAQNQSATPKLQDPQANNLPPQKLLQGPPGTGKSFKLKQDTPPGAITERVVCHPEMTNAHFIGAYRPQRAQDAQGTEQRVTYDFDPGPLTRMLKSALEKYLQYGEDARPHVLIIEELNRANSAAMFADAFQLLDRGARGWSEHATHMGVDVHRCLGEGLIKEMRARFELEHPDDEGAQDVGVRFPPNLCLWATMNTADQGVFPMDTAFKRRWSFEYLGVDGDERVPMKERVWMRDEWNPWLCGGAGEEGGLRWQTLRRAINEALDEQGVEEDRQLGPFFLDQRELGGTQDELIEHVVNKVIGYLRDDVLRYEPYKLFAAQEERRAPSFAKLRRLVRSGGVLSVFKPEALRSVISEAEFSAVCARFDARRVAQGEDGSASGGSVEADSASGGASVGADEVASASEGASGDGSTHKSAGGGGA